MGTTIWGRACSTLKAAIDKARPRDIPAMVQSLEVLLERARARSKGGLPRKDLPLDLIREKAAIGMWKPSSIARVLGFPKSTFLDPHHREAVLDAIEDGRAQFEANAMEHYQNAINGGKVDKAVFALLIFQQKQLGWTDKLQSITPGMSPQDATGARERLKMLIEKGRAQHA